MGNKEIGLVTKPWGYEQHLPEMIPYKEEEKTKHRSKILVVYPGEMLSLQYHMMRDEYWKVLSGSGLIVVGKKQYKAYTGTEWFIPAKVWHRLSAAKKEPIVVKEFSTGEVWNDADIIRIDDKYKRGHE